MNYFGDFAEDATVYIPFNTFTSDDPSASATITDLVDGDIKVHKDGNADQIVTDGATIAINFDGVTGNHLITIDTNIDAAYSTGSDYLVRIEGTTVDGATINAWVGTFSIENRFVRGTDNAYTGTPPTVSQIQTELEENGVSLLDTIRDELANGSDGLTALKTAIDAIPTTMVGTDNAALASVVGALADGAAAGEVTSADTLMQYLKQLINILIGNAGIVTFKSSAAPGNGISLSEVLRDIQEDTTAIQAKLPASKFMGSSDGADDDGTLNTIAGDVANIDGIVPAAVSDLGTVQTGDSFAIVNGVAGLVAINTDVEAILADTGTNGVLVSATAITAIWAKAMSDLAQGAPSATASVLTAINYLYEAWRNKTETTATLITVLKDDGATALVKATIADDATTFTKDEFISGA